MKKNLLIFFLLFLSHLHAQPWDLSGEWTGYVTQNQGIRNIYFCKLYLEQFGNQIKGGSYFDFFDDKSIFVTFALKGEIKKNVLIYQETKVLEDYIPPKYKYEISGWCIKSANLTISETQDSLILRGNWTGEPNTGWGYCSPGYFYVSKPKPHKQNNSNNPITQTIKTDSQNQTEKPNNEFVLPQSIHKGDKFIIPNIQFKPSTSELLPESFPILDKLVSYMKSRPELKIKIVGHTDIGKDPQYNQTLSQSRADAVKSYLIQKDIHPSRIQTEGKGNTEPIADNNTSEGRAQNRRVEIIVLE
jgi:outer membrane protein OmpA-like peptidoglycan-associated protein